MEAPWSSRTFFLEVGGIAGEDLGLGAFDSRVNVGRRGALNGVHGVDIYKELLKREHGIRGEEHGSGEISSGRLTTFSCVSVFVLRQLSFEGVGNGTGSWRWRNRSRR